MTATQGEGAAQSTTLSVNIAEGLLCDEGPLLTSPMARFEASISLARARSGARGKPSPAPVEACAALVSEFVEELSARDIHITGSIGDCAIQASAEYGKIVGHPADLNFGDCFAYACARAYRLKLIDKGSDFAQTDLA